jgi:maleate isomerase
MPDSLGYRMKFGVIAPSTNTSVQPEYDGFRPFGVTNHFARIHIPNNPVTSDVDFEKLMRDIRKTLFEAVDRVITCSPGSLIMGMSAETFWDGLEGSIELEQKVQERAGIPVAMGSDACRAALKAYGGVRRISVLTPYMQVGDEQVRKFFADCGFDVVNIIGLKCESPQQIAHVSEQKLRDTVIALDGPGVDAIIQVGTNLAFARVAALAEFWLDKPVIAINTATYWWALRQAGIKDKIFGFGKLLQDH